MVATALLLVLLAVATATDLRRHKVYNWTTYPGILAAWGLNALGSLLARVEAVDRQTLASLGWVGLWPSFAGFLACGGVLTVCYVFFRVGGGDVKLMAMTGALLALEGGLKTMLWTLVLGGCAGLVVLIWRVGPLRLVGAALGHLRWTLRLGRLDPPTAEERIRLQSRLYLAPSALAAAMIVQFSLVERLTDGVR
jgi:prepilin peptidase CpaA